MIPFSRDREKKSSALYHELCKFPIAVLPTRMWHVRGSIDSYWYKQIWMTYDLGEAVSFPSHPFALSGGWSFSVPLLIMHNVMRIVVCSRRLHEGRANVADKRIRRMEWIVAVALRRTVVYHGSSIVLSCVQLIFGRRLFVSIPIIGDASLSGRLFLKKNDFFFSLPHFTLQIIISM